MPFILDSAIQTIFQSKTGGGHAFYSHICWEYLVDFDAYRRLHSYPFTVSEATEESIGAIVGNLNRLVDRWCYPTKDFVVEILEKLCAVVDYCLDQGPRSEYDLMLDSAYNTDGKFRAWLGRLWTLLPEQYSTGTAAKDEGWETFKEFQAWKSAFIDQNLRVKGAMAPFNTVDSGVTSFLFGWNRELKFPASSLCAELIKFIEGFVKIVDNIADGKDSAFHKAAMRKIMGTEQTKDIRRFSWPCVFRMNLFAVREMQELGEASRSTPKNLTADSDAQQLGTRRETREIEPSVEPGVRRATTSVVA